MPEGRVQLIAYSPRLDTALRRLISGELETRRYTPAQSETTPKQTLLASGKVTQAEVDYSYNGYFKIIDASTYNEDGTLAEAKIKIVDGATYDEETGTSGKGICKVNNVVFQVDPYQSGVIVNDSIFALKYTASGKKVEVVNLADEGENSLPDDTNENCWYQIGRVFIASGQVEIQQDHLATSSNGIPQLFWYDLCETTEN